MQEQRQERRVLRQKAEALLKERNIPLSYTGQLELGSLLEEVRVYQAELEIQNQEMAKVHAELIESRDALFEPFEHAPVAYCLVTVEGVIEKANARAEDLLGRHRSQIELRPFATFLSADDYPAFTCCCAKPPSKVSTAYARCACAPTAKDAVPSCGWNLCR